MRGATFMHNFMFANLHVVYIDFFFSAGSTIHSDKSYNIYNERVAGSNPAVMYGNLWAAGSGSLISNLVADASVPPHYPHPPQLRRGVR